MPGGAQGCLIAQIREIRSAQPRCRPGESFEIDILREAKMTRVNTQDAFPPAPVRQRHDHLSIKAPWTQQRRIEDVRPIRRREQNHLLAIVEPIHLHE